MRVCVSCFLLSFLLQFMTLPKGLVTCQKPLSIDNNMSRIIVIEQLDCVYKDSRNTEICLCFYILNECYWRQEAENFEVLELNFHLLWTLSFSLCTCGNVLFNGMNTYYFSARSQISFGSQFLAVSSLFLGSSPVIKTVLVFWGFIHMVHANSNIHDISWYVCEIQL